MFGSGSNASRTCRLAFGHTRSMWVETIQIKNWGELRKIAHENDKDYEDNYLVRVPGYLKKRVTQSGIFIYAQIVSCIWQINAVPVH